MDLPLRQEEWDFSSMPPNEYGAALRWEVLRECPDAAETVTEAKAWLNGTLSTRRPPLPPDKRKPRRFWFSEAESAQIHVGAFFQNFIPTHEFSFLHKWTLTQKRKEYDRWQARHIRPLVTNLSLPWLCLPQVERTRICSIIENSRWANVVHIPSWFVAISHFDKEKIDKGQPLIFSHSSGFSETTTVLLRIEWRHTKKRILAAIKKILDECEPEGVKRWNSRGRKHRDKLIALERLGMMRLLHHYTLAEVRLKLPEAWKLYATRKWYDERRQGLKDFRGRSNYGEPEKFFPVSWETRAQRSRQASDLPGK
jgi:hypothetical protein